MPPDDPGGLFFSECGPGERAWATPQIGLEPLAPLSTPLVLSAARWGSVSRVYIETLRDRTLPLASQRAMIARTGVDEVITIDTDHSPALRHARETAELLIAISARHPAPIRH